MKIALLAAGFATRLHPLTLDRAKPLLEVGGRPVLTRILDSLLEIGGVTQVVVVTNHKFHHQFEEWRAARSWPVPVLLVNDGATSDDNKLGGVADMALALARAADSPPADPEGYLVVAGDNLLEFDLRPFATRFRADGRPLMPARHFDGPVPPRRHAEVVVDEGGVIQSFREKPEVHHSPLASTCLYFFPTPVRDWLDQYLGGGGNPDAPGHFLAWLSGQTEVLALPFKGHCRDIGNPQSLAEVRALYEQRESPP